MDLSKKVKVEERESRQEAGYRVVFPRRTKHCSLCLYCNEEGGNVEEAMSICRMSFLHV